MFCYSFVKQGPRGRFLEFLQDVVEKPGRLEETAARPLQKRLGRGGAAAEP